MCFLILVLSHFSMCFCWFILLLLYDYILSCLVLIFYSDDQETNILILNVLGINFTFIKCIIKCTFLYQGKDKVTIFGLSRSKKQLSLPSWCCISYSLTLCLCQFYQRSKTLFNYYIIIILVI